VKLTELGVIPASSTQDLAALLLPDVEAARRQSFWAARGHDVRGHVQTLFRDFESVQEPAASREDVFASQPASSTGQEMWTSPPAARSVPSPSRGELLAQLSDMYATALEYPVEVFTEDVQLEADLGVDSVKQTELLARAAERYHLPERPADFRLSDCTTIGKVADFVLGAMMVAGRGRLPALAS
jgi:acyl carrier protein